MFSLHLTKRLFKVMVFHHTCTDLLFCPEFYSEYFLWISPHTFYHDFVFMHWNCRDRMYGSWVWLDCKFKTSATTCIPLPGVLQAESADTHRHEQSVNISTKASRKKRIFYGQADRKGGGGGVSPLGPDRKQM